MLKSVLHRFVCLSLSAFLFAPVMAASAQIAPPLTAPPLDERELPAPEPILPDIEIPLAVPELENDGADTPAINKPDYSHLSEAEERSVRLDSLFTRLSEAEDEEQAELVAEEIWAIWLDSGSASVNFVLRRGTAAQKQGKLDLARRLYDQTTYLLPEYAEGWARSSRLALVEEDLSRALTETAKTLTLEPRHFFALWTMGNVFEQLNRGEEAIEAYREAHKLHPQLKAVKDRLDALESQLNGDVL